MAGRQRADPSADGGIAGYRKHAGGHFAKLGIVFLKDISYISKGLPYAEVCAFVIVAVFGGVHAHLIDVFVAFKISVKGF